MKEYLKMKKKYTTKEKILISFSFWPTLLIGIALGMTISLLLVQSNLSYPLLITRITYSIIGLLILGVITRAISIFYWKKYNWRFISDIK